MGASENVVMYLMDYPLTLSVIQVSRHRKQLLAVEGSLLQLLIDFFPIQYSAICFTLSLKYIWICQQQQSLVPATNIY